MILILLAAGLAVTLGLLEVHRQSTTLKKSAPPPQATAPIQRRTSQICSKKKSGSPYIRQSTQNVLAVISTGIVLVQWTHQLFVRSKFYLRSFRFDVYLSVLSLSLSDSTAYYAIVVAVVALWLCGLVYATSLRSYFVKIGVSKVLLGRVNQQLSLVMPAVAALMFVPGLEYLLSALDCRYWDDRVFVSLDYNVKCWTGSHWVMVVASVMLSLPFVFGIIRFAAIWKAFRQNFDLNDHPAYSIFEPTLKFLGVIGLAYLPTVAFYSVFIVLMAAAVVVLEWKQPNRKLWFNHVRAAHHVGLLVLAVVFLAYECSIATGDFGNYRSAQIALTIITAVLLNGGLVVYAIFVQRQFQPQLTKEKQEELDKKINNLFLAIKYAILFI